MEESKRKTILIVDDDVLFSSIIIEDIKSEGFIVHFARSVKEAKDIIINNDIEIVITDIMLPTDYEEIADQMDIISLRAGFRAGFSLARWIKLNHPNITLLAYSNSTENEVKTWFNEYADGFFEKDLLNRSYLIQYLCRKSSGPNSFIVHGHDEKTKLELKNYLQNILNFPEPIILHEQPSFGRSIFKKFEEEAKTIDLVFVLLTPDDTTWDPDKQDNQKHRARQNVIFEMGYFLAKFEKKRGRVILLYKGEIELPSDIAGLIYIDISKGVEAAGESIRKEVLDFL